MKDLTGYIKLHRKSYDNFLYNENRPSTRREAWEDILVNVNYADSNVLMGDQLIECKRGQSILSLDSWGRMFKWDKSKVRRFFNLLQSASMISIENLQKTTRLTVCNYDYYQGAQNAGDTPVTRKRHAGDTLATPIKEEEEEKEEKEEYSFDEFWDSYDKKVGKKDKVKIKFDKLSKQDKMQIKEYLPKYVRSTPDKNFRKNPETFLNNEAWKDEIVSMFKDYDKEPTERLCYFLSKYSGQGAEIKAPLSRYEKEVRDFGQDAVKFLRYAD